MTYAGNDTMSSSRGTGLHGDGSGGVIGYGSRGSRNAVHPPAAINNMARHRARMRSTRLDCDMANLRLAFLNSASTARQANWCLERSACADGISGTVSIIGKVLHQ